MTTERIEEIRKELNKYLADNDCPHRAYGAYYGLARVLMIDINWGDWKHDHLRAMHLVDKFSETLEAEKITLVMSDTTEEDGSDAYSATHYYFVGEKISSDRYEKMAIVQGA